MMGRYEKSVLSGKGVCLTNRFGWGMDLLWRNKSERRALRSCFVSGLFMSGQDQVSSARPESGGYRRGEVDCPGGVNIMMNIMKENKGQLGDNR